MATERKLPEAMPGFILKLGKFYHLTLFCCLFYQTSNSDDRQGKRHCFVLYAFVPILQEAPEGWSLALVDTPGFGEANVEHIMKHTDMLFSTSTAYLYLMDATSMDDKVDSDNFKLLFQHDKGQ